MLHYETIYPNTLELLKKIQSLDMFKESRLVGGTALALQLGHRVSIDLDFFGKIDAPLEDIVFELSSYQAIIMFFNVPAIVRRSLIHSLCPRL